METSAIIYFIDFNGTLVFQDNKAQLSGYDGLFDPQNLLTKSQ